MKMIYNLKVTKEDLPASLYAIYFYGVKFTRQDIISVKNTLRRYRKKYPYIGFLLTISNTSSKYCTKREIKLKNHRGRPPTIVLGQKIQTHLHLSIIGDDNHSAYSATKKIVQSLNKRFNGQCSMRCKGRNRHAKNFIKYSLKQSNSTWSTGLFKELIEKKKGIASKKF